MLTPSESALAQAVLIHGPIFRHALTARLGLSPASLTRLAKPFVERGVFVERDHLAAGAVGRPARPLDFAPDWGTFVGVKLTGTRAYGVLTDARADLLTMREEPLPSPDPADVARVVRGLVARLAPHPHGHPHRLRGLGISLGGEVVASRVRFAPFLDWHDVDIVGAVEASVPVTVENDVVALTEAERWFGQGRGIRDFSVITIGAGVGHGLVVGGDVVRGPDAGVGHVGHLPLAVDGPMCSRGHRGCAAMLTSASLRTQLAGALGREVGDDDVLALAAAGEPAAASLVGAAGDALGRLIALVTSITQQSRAILAGEGVGLYRIAEERVRAAIRAGRDPRADEVEVLVDDGGFFSWARGAAAVSIQAAVERIDLSRDRLDG